MRSGTRHVLLVGCCTVALLGATACKSSEKQAAPAATEIPPAAQSSQATASTSNGVMKPTNIVLITLDTVRADHLHCYGNAKIKTPTIDALANSGVLFEKAVAQAPLTLPSHASMFTGTNPNVHHVRDTGGFVLQPSSVRYHGDHLAQERVEYGSVRRSGGIEARFRIQPGLLCV